MALLLEQSAIPGEWINWSDEDDWGRMAEEFDRATTSDRIRENWEQFEVTQRDVLRISKTLLDQIDALAQPMAIETDEEVHAKRCRLRARESEGLQSIAEALQRVTKVRLMVLEGLSRPLSIEDDNATHLKPVVPNWKTVTQVCEYFGISRGTLARWRDQNKISTINTPGGQRRYDINSVPLDTPIRAVTANLKRGKIHASKSEVENNA
jgi:excisionase family DNA binding protein